MSGYPAGEDMGQEPEPSSEELAGLARRLVDEGLLDARSAQRLECQAQRQECSFMSHLIDVGALTARQVAEVASREYGLPVIDLETLAFGELPPVEQYPQALLRRLEVLPLRHHGQRLTVAIDHPAKLAELDELRFATGLTPEGVLAPRDQLAAWLDRYLTPRNDALAALARMEATPISTGAGREDDIAASGTSHDDAPLIAFIDSILQEAIQHGASDIHFEPYAEHLRIRLRIDGMLHDVAHPPVSMRSRIAARLKVMAHLDISERRLPQDGAIKWRHLGGPGIDFRVSTLPTVHGEKIVLRLLDPTTAHWHIDQLGLSPIQRRLYESALSAPQGMILVTGPTGSGKTVTLYTGLGRLNEASRNICTAEDPVEIKLEGINQVNVQPRIGLDFASTLRAFLRQDPDVVMVGEIRDRETAEIAIKASQTGHLVLSTVHTNSAAQTLTRLVDMGIAPFNIASSVSLIIAQRLARRLCDHCKRPVVLDERTLQDLGIDEQAASHADLHEPVGCSYCTQGFKGRIGLYETVPIDSAMRERILRRGKGSDLEAQARRSGYPSLWHDGLDKALQGLTSLAEVNRVTGNH
ncbi:type IV-A pilus assembly ATPase PilB [Halomonas caseinilytica]|uniref:Type IV pilus assembly protein PilB n=2 Tax=Halomonas caseinilytica TaxID=438744 RepID=A0A1M6TW83_9GAMM|nr:type IV-A pilus assembly ATPase PilB [Halomonas caseinilytica]SHK61282.1 type IV pilus assembly protein PilB [Halomonas caseinilytica]